MNYRLIVAAACALLSSCAPAAPPLDDLIGFSNPEICEPSEAFAALLSSLVDTKEAGDTYIPVLRKPLVPAKFKAQVGAPKLRFDGHEYRASLPLHGTWRGLPLRSVEVVGWIESEEGFELIFDLDPERVLATANQAGFGIPASGGEYQEGEVLGMNVRVAQHDGGAALSCIPG